jgi:hypothetical protein
VFLEGSRKRRLTLSRRLPLRKLAVLFVFNKYGEEDVAQQSLSKFAMLLERNRDKDVRLEIFARFLSSHWNETVLNVFFAACAYIGDGRKASLVNLSFMVQDMDIGLLPFFMLMYDLREMGTSLLDPALVIDQFVCISLATFPFLPFYVQNVTFYVHLFGFPPPVFDREKMN